jgi:hypothetical protein
MKRVNTRVFLAMKSGVCLLQKKHVGVQTFIAANKNRRKWKAKNKDAPRKMHSIQSNKNIVS